MAASKRIIDVFLSLSALCVLVPVLLAIAVAVVLDTGFPVLFSQCRIGRDFRPFRIWKFRSMYPNSKGPSITAGGDPRITRVGRFLRLTKLDELPQLWNVVVGDMSLVGPRPEIQEYVERFRDRYLNILTVRPGITDFASLHFRDEEKRLAVASDPGQEYLERILPAKLDLAEEYIRLRSIQLDFSILLDTVRSILQIEPRS